MTESELRGWLALTLVPGLGPVKINGLRVKLGEPPAISACSDNQLMAAGLNENQVRVFRQPDERPIEVTLEWLAAPGHYAVPITDSAYPPMLREIATSPQLLFAKGDTSILNNLQLAIVGSRNPTNNGYETAYEFSKHLTIQGLTITSGLALGIDAASHLGCLDANGKTIAVTGNGLDRVYPGKHRQLAHRIAEQGLLISEYLPGTKPLAPHFPRRNRIIAGLSLGTLVVEAGTQSGSLITARRALEQNREVFAIPGSIHNPLARGCHQLIKRGAAKLVESAQDILEELGTLANAQLEINSSDNTTVATRDHSDNDVHQSILDAMSFDPVSVDTLARRVGLEVAELSSVLLILELENKISAEGGGYYVRNSQT